MNALNQIVNMYLDHAERMAQSGIPMHMSDWEKALNEFLQFERADILEGPGKIFHFLAEQKAFQEYELFDDGRQISLQNDLSINCLAEIEKKAK